MPQIIVKGLSQERTARLSPIISRQVAAAIDVPPQWIVVEHNNVSFYREGKEDTGLCTIIIQWKARPRALQQTVSKLLSELILGEGCDTVEVMFTNLDMDEFYEYKGE